MELLFVITFLFMQKSSIKEVENIFIQYRISVLAEVLTIHCYRGEIERKGYIFYIDPAEYIPGNIMSQRLGIKKGDDITISKQRMMYEIYYDIYNGITHYEVIQKYPVRTAKYGFGFERYSGRTPTGLYLLTNPLLSIEAYTSMSYKFPMEITTGKISISCITTRGRSIYRELWGMNDPSIRGVILHGFGRTVYEERYLDIGSRGCVHTISDGIISIGKRINEREATYIFISGGETDFSDLPEYEKKIFIDIMR